MQIAARVCVCVSTIGGFSCWKIVDRQTLRIWKPEIEWNDSSSNAMNLQSVKLAKNPQKSRELVGDCWQLQGFTNFSTFVVAVNAATTTTAVENQSSKLQLMIGSIADELHSIMEH